MIAGVKKNDGEVGGRASGGGGDEHGSERRHCGGKHMTQQRRVVWRPK